MTRRAVCPATGRHTHTPILTLTLTLILTLIVILTSTLTHNQVIAVDGVASLDDVVAIRAAVQRGVSVVATCLGRDLQQLLTNPDLNPLLGGTQPAADSAPHRCEAHPVLMWA